MRLFVALDLPDKTKEDIYNQLAPLRKKYPDFAWVDPHNYHLTLHFIGQTQTQKVDAIAEKLKNILYDKFSFHLYAYDLDLFLSHKITIYLSLRREKKLEEIVKEINNNLNSFDQLHLTLARYRVPSKQQYLLIKKTIQKFELEIEFPVNKIFLFQSNLFRNIPTYKKLASFSLLK